MPELILSRKWARFTLRYQIPFGLKHLEALGFSNFDLRGAYVSREVARFGFPTNQIGDLEYELRRNWKKYPLLFTRGRLRIDSTKIPYRGSESQLNTEAVCNRINKYLPGNYLTEYFVSPIAVPSTEFNRVTFRGSAHLDTRKRLAENYNGNWNFLDLQEATVIHGKIAFSEGKFYTGDNTKVPSFGSSFNSWPGFLYQRMDGNYVAEAKYPVHPELDEAMLLGGTKNWMHFVIEDLPRLLIFDTIDLDFKIPLLVSSELGLQILESIRAMTSRPIIVLRPNSYLKIKKLHVLQFNNPLSETMMGDKGAGSVLFSAELLQRARKLLLTEVRDAPRYPTKVLIRREPGLFRPLINAVRLQKTLEKKFGFETFYLTDLSLKEIFSIFSDARTVVGEYGAGLANMIFCPPGCKILEIRGGLESRAREYQALAEALNLEHSFVHGKNRLISRFGISRGPYKIKLESVTRLLDK
jgi:capsular polysaccharide biosynthesis protein